MKLLTLISMGIAASYCYKTIKYNKQNLSNLSFDEVINQHILRDFIA
ncbi:MULTISPECIES: hypothetical protein [unclassified Acinetobacter]|nr:MULTISPECIES: hypothetical protein [unclassified Acinetobacter]UNW07742.1 hypothetical protein MOV98_06570 [Acinetobacter variabilis]